MAERVDSGPYGIVRDFVNGALQYDALMADHKTYQARFRKAGVTHDKERADAYYAQASRLAERLRNLERELKTYGELKGAKEVLRYVREGHHVLWSYSGFGGVGSGTTLGRRWGVGGPARRLLRSGNRFYVQHTAGSDYRKWRSNAEITDIIKRTGVAKNIRRARQFGWFNQPEVVTFSVRGRTADEKVDALARIMVMLQRRPEEHTLDTERVVAKDW